MERVLRALLSLLAALLMTSFFAVSLVHAETPDLQFGIGNPSFADYFQKRGGLRTFGYPISRQFKLNGFQVQLFQRGMMQLLPGGNVASMNLLDSGLMPYSSFNFSAVPGPQRDLMDAAPSPLDPDYARKAIDFVKLNAPDIWQGLPVNFGATFLSTVRLEDAFPEGNGNSTLVPLLNLEFWGLPTSYPAYDPNNHRFVYQRFQRGIMHFDVETGSTQGLLLGDYLKSVMTGRDLPPDLEAQAADSPLLRQYDASSDVGPLSPGDLPDSDLSSAFKPGTGDPRFGVVVMGPRVDDPVYVASTLATLGAGAYFSFGEVAEGPGKVQLVRPGADFSEVAARAREHPGRAWLIGNEPNVIGQDDMKPEDYADFLAKTASAVKAADPTATLVGPNVLNWDKTCDGCPGYRSGHSWSEEFVQVYSRKYGALPLDAWGMHTYSLDWNHLPLTNAADDQAQLLGARAWLDAIGMNKPLWLSEFGVVWGYEGIDWQEKSAGWIASPTGRFREDLIADYIDSMLKWLSESGRAARVEKAFLYSTSSPPEPWATTTGGVVLTRPGTVSLTPLGERFRRWAVGLGSE